MSGFDVAIQTASDTVKKEQKSRRCKHPKHPTTHIRKDGVCPQAWKCKDKHDKGCLLEAVL